MSSESTAEPTAGPSAEPTAEEVVEAVYRFGAEQMRDGASPAEVEQMLIERGLRANDAHTVVENLKQARSQAISSAAQKNMLVGGLWCVGGIVVTAATYAAASGGGTYVVAWGAIIFGAIQFFRGLSQLGDG